MQQTVKSRRARAAGRRRRSEKVSRYDKAILFTVQCQMLDVMSAGGKMACGLMFLGMATDDLNQRCCAVASRWPGFAATFPRCCWRSLGSAHVMMRLLSLSEVSEIPSISAFAGKSSDDGCIVSGHAHTPSPYGGDTLWGAIEVQNGRNLRVPRPVAGAVAEDRSLGAFGLGDPAFDRQIFKFKHLQDTDSTYM